MKNAPRKDEISQEISRILAATNPVRVGSQGRTADFLAAVFRNRSGGSNMFAHRRMIMALPLCLLVPACASNNAGVADNSGVTVVANNGETIAPADAAGTPGFAEGYKALKDANYSQATMQLASAHDRAPSDPYDALDLGAAYQNQGMVDRALPLYRVAIQDGQSRHPSDTTLTSDQGLTVAQIAQRNCVKARLDENCNPMQAVAFVPPPPQSGPGVHKYQVFFEFDKSALTPDAIRVIRQAADDARSGNATRINLTGHTDTVGSAAYNEGLSERRADSVQRMLISDGIAGDEIMARGVGKTDLLVPTPDGVREPQNRRVEIVEEEVRGM
jgi:outer membrane protein OmpA-like peptidoglycan-associated protein